MLCRILRSKSAVSIGSSEASVVRGLVKGHNSCVQMCNNSSNVLAKSMNAKLWNPCDNLITTSDDTNSYAVLILNTPIGFSENVKVLLNLWEYAKVRITVDGGTDHWMEWLKLHVKNVSSVPLPDLITGDMDSVLQDTLKYFATQSDQSQIIINSSQKETDFTKALEQLKLYCYRYNCEINTVYVIVDSCGRMDHIMANINTLFEAGKVLSNCTDVFLVAANSISWLLRKGKHSIAIPRCTLHSKDWCSLVPISAARYVTTSGLKWNLDNSKLEFGHLISTSNTYDQSSLVTVETDGEILWSMGIESLLKSLL